MLNDLNDITGFLKQQEGLNMQSILIETKSFKWGIEHKHWKTTSDNLLKQEFTCLIQHIPSDNSLLFFYSFFPV